MVGRWLSLVGALVVLSTATGCIEEKLEVQVEQDGRGKVVFERVMGAQMSGMLLSMAPDKDEAMASSAAEAFAEFQGVDAWTDVETFVRDGKIGFKGTGWFADPAQLRRVSDSNEMRFNIAQADGKLTVRLDREEREQQGGRGGDRQDEMFTSPDAQFEQQRGMAKGMLAPMLGELRMEIAVRMPGDVGDVTGFTKDGRRAAWVMDGKQMVGMIDRVFERVAELRPKIKAGELTTEQAKEQLEREFSDIAGTNDLAASCPAGTADAAARAAFDEGLAKAREAWATSEWKTKIEKAREEDADPMGGGEGEGMGGGEVR